MSGSLTLVLSSNVPKQTLLFLLLRSSCRFIVLRELGYPSYMILPKSVAFSLLPMSYK